MSKSKADLKNALESLQVKNPLRLAAKAPTFQPPTLDPGVDSIPGSEPSQGSEASQHTNSIQGLNQPQVEIPHLQKNPENTAETIGPIPGQNSSLGQKTTQERNSSLGSISSQDENAPGIEPAAGVQIARRSQPRQATSQDEAVLAARRVESGMDRGYTRVPNSLLMRVISGECSKHEIQILLLVARLTISFRRKMAPMSKSVVERFTGIRGSAALHALTSLETTGMVNRIPGDERRPTQVGLRIDSDWDWLQQESVVSNPGCNSGPRVENTPASPGSFSPTLNNMNTNYNKNNNPLSLNSEKLRNYFSSIKPPKKRASELQAFSDLRQDYSEVQVERAWSHLVERGLPGNGESCHSPMAFLGMAMERILAEANAEIEKANEKALRERRAAEESRNVSEKAAKEAREFELQERAFRRAFPTEERQSEAFGELCRGIPFSAQSQTGRALAISAWWSSLSRYDQAELLEGL